jgi:hypothetical protein
MSFEMSLPMNDKMAMDEHGGCRAEGFPSKCDEK